MQKEVSSLSTVYTGDEHTTYKSDSPKDSTRVYNGWLRVYRYVDYESPEIKSDIETSKKN